MEEVKTKFGLKYKPEHDEELVAFLSEGHSFEAFAGHVKCSRTTLYSWKEAHESFAEAQWVGEQARKKMIEASLVECGKTGKGNASALVFLAKNWCGMRDDYNFDHTSKGDKISLIDIVSEVEKRVNSNAVLPKTQAEEGAGG